MPNLKLLCCLLAFCFISATAIADMQEQEPSMVHSSLRGCDEDIQKYCDGLGNNVGKIFMCIAVHEVHLDEKCKARILELAGSEGIAVSALSYAADSCKSDVYKYCAEVQPGEKRLTKCLKAHESEGSKECITALKETGIWNIGN